MAVRIKWDQYETALLIDTFWRIEEQPALRQELIKKLSDDLRRKAVSQGIVIDDVFRNVNGITMQLSSIAHSFFPKRPYLTSSTIFDSMVKLYKEDRPAFDQVLREANRMISCLDNDICARIDRKPGFEQWLANKGKKPSEISGIVSTLEDASSFAKKRKIVQYSFWEETEKEFSVSSAKLMTLSYFAIHILLFPFIKKDIENYDQALEKYGKANKKNQKISLNIDYAQATYDWVAEA